MLKIFFNCYWRLQVFHFNIFNRFSDAAFSQKFVEYQ
jgi:hypothetical protein